MAEYSREYIFDIFFTNISEGTAFLLQGLTYNEKPVQAKTLRFDIFQIVKSSLYVRSWKTLKKEGRAFRNIGKRYIGYIFLTVKSAMLLLF